MKHYFKSSSTQKKVHSIISISHQYENNDEWWKAKLRIEKSEGDENTKEGQIGLAESKSGLKAVYDYKA
ncbi:18414_t:CDS:2 [Dentiscutata erythropus]|uniref:18414_t:CDS:1 n=1 Tax=Dentiscutata erythropus TaxID=1348616 RepID=A0A9N9G1E4_9GLOM|nr:18414_t:CDS:2 [Dentiscutata erythropus]